jgi:hypothetical protein
MDLIIRELKALHLYIVCFADDLLIGHTNQYSKQQIMDLVQTIASKYLLTIN